MSGGGFLGCKIIRHYKGLEWPAAAILRVCLPFAVEIRPKVSGPKLSVPKDGDCFGFVSSDRGVSSGGLPRPRRIATVALRADDVITTAGYRVGPGEIEECLMKHPAVALAAAVGIPDPVRTEAGEAAGAGTTSARAGLYAYSLITRATQEGRRGAGLPRSSARAGFRPPRDERGAPAAGAARGAGMAQCRLRRRSRRRAELANPRSVAPHALAVARRGDEAEIAEPTGRLFNEIGLLLRAKADYAEAEPLMRRALAIDEKSYSPDHPEVANRLQQSRASAQGHEPPRRGGAALSPLACDRREDLRPGSNIWPI